jgi:hypothetical protein
MVSWSDAAEDSGPEWVLEFVELAGRRRESLSECSAIEFERTDPVRRFRWSKGSERVRWLVVVGDDGPSCGLRVLART